MNNRVKNIALTATIAMVSACGLSNKTTKANISKDSSNKHAYLLKAYKQTTLPGRPAPGEGPTTEHRFIIIWNSAQSPETFFWKNDDIWEPCQVSKVSNYAPNSISEQNPYNKGYNAAEISLFKIAKGDTLELIPITGSKNPIPSSLPKKTNSIFYKATNTDWLTLPVKSIEEMPDIILQ